MEKQWELRIPRSGIHPRSCSFALSSDKFVKMGLQVECDLNSSLCWFLLIVSSKVFSS
jgi:hypothetical protein